MSVDDACGRLLRNCANWSLNASGADAVALRLSQSCAGRNRSQPGRGAASATSFHFGWKGGCWNCRILAKNPSTVAGPAGIGAQINLGSRVRD